MNYLEFQNNLKKMRQLAQESGIDLLKDDGSTLTDGDIFSELAARWDELAVERRTELSVIIADLIVAEITGQKEKSKKEQIDKNAKFLKDNLPLELQIWVMALLNIGISVVKDDGEIISNDEYLNLLSSKWNTLTDAERIAVSLAHVQQMLVNYIREVNENGGNNNETANQ